MGKYAGELKGNKITVRCNDRVNDYINSFHGTSLSEKFNNMMNTFMGQVDKNADVFKQQCIVEELTKEKQELLKDIVALQGTKEILNSVLNNLKKLDKDYVGEMVGRKHKAIEEEIKESGFYPRKILIKNMDKLNQLSGRNNSLQDVFNAWKNNEYKDDKEMKELLNEISKELKAQELERMPGEEIGA